MIPIRNLSRVGSAIFVFFAACFVPIACSGQPTGSPSENLALLRTVSDLLRNDELKAELEVLDGQVEAIDEICKKFNQQYQLNELTHRKEISTKLLQDGMDDDSKETLMRELQLEFNKNSEELAKESVKEFKEILVAHQIERLKELSNQVLLGLRIGPFTMLRNTYMSLGIAKSDESPAAKSLKAIREKYEQQLKELQKKTWQEVQDSLDTKDRKALKEFIGDPSFPPVN